MRIKLLAAGVSLVALAGVRAGADCGPYVPQPPAPPQNPTPPEGDNPADPPPPPEGGGPQTPGGSGGGGPSTPGGDSGGPSTPGGGGGGPETGPGGGGGAPVTGGGPDTGGSGGGGGPTTGGGRPGGDGGPAPSGGAPGTPGDARGGRQGDQAKDHGSWSYWWLLNRAAVLDLSARGPLAARTPGQGDGRPEVWREQAHAALTASLDDGNELVARDAVMALGKARDSADALVLAGLVVNAKRSLATRQAAAIALGLVPASDEMSPGSTRKVLERTARDSAVPPQLRAACLYALGMRRDPASVPLLAEFAAAGAPTWDIPAAALTALGLSGCPLARENLEALLAGPKNKNDREMMRRVYAAHGLALLRDPASLPALRGALDDESADVRRAAALALGAVAPGGCAETTKALAGVLTRDRDRICRGMAAISLGRLGGEPALAALRHAQAENEASLRPYVALGLGLAARDAKDEAVAKALLRDLNSGQQAEFEGALCVAVGLTRRPEAIATLRTIVKETKDPDVRGHAAVALGLAGDTQEGFAVMRPLFEAPIPRLQGEAGLGLSFVASNESVTWLGDMLAKGQEGTQAAAALALGRIGGAEAAKHLVAALTDKSQSALTRRMAANGLGLALDRSGGRATSSVATDLDWCALTSTVVDFVNAQ
jgi:HEAT repeat protein